MSPAEKEAIQEFTSFITATSSYRSGSYRSVENIVDIEDVQIEFHQITIWAVLEYSHGEYCEEWHKHEHDPDNDWECSDSEPNCPDGF